MHPSSWSHFWNRSWESTGTTLSQPSPILQRSRHNILASITKGATNPKRPNRWATQLNTTHSVTHRSPGTTTSLNEKQCPGESHCILRTFSNPSSTHLSWNSPMTSYLTWVLLELHWVRHMPASLIITLASWSCYMHEHGHHILKSNCQRKCYCSAPPPQERSNTETNDTWW